MSDDLYPKQHCNFDLRISSVASSVVGLTEDDGNKKDAVLGPCEHSAAPPATDELHSTTPDAARRTSDTSVYLYYARAAGLTATVCFLSVTMACTFCESFAGELYTRQQSIVPWLTWAVLWLQWWARSELAHPSRRVGFYLGIYVFLNALGSVLFLVGCWYVSYYHESLRQMLTSQSRLNIVRMTSKSALILHRALLDSVVRYVRLCL